MNQEIYIILKSNGEGILKCSGLGSFKCLGKAGYPFYPKNIITVNPNNKNDKQRIHYSGEFIDSSGNPYKMEFCILVNWQKGVYIHAGENTLISNGGPSAGCIHLKREDAQKVFNWIKTKTRIRIRTAW